jgi:hypothetical protein
VNEPRITSAALSIPEDLIRTGVAPRAWIITRHMDLATWDELYWMHGHNIARPAWRAMIMMRRKSARSPLLFLPLTIGLLHCQRKQWLASTNLL